MTAPRTLNLPRLAASFTIQTDALAEWVWVLGRAAAAVAGLVGAQILLGQSVAGLFVTAGSVFVLVHIQS
jgi:hypothetical protein